MSGNDQEDWLKVAEAYQLFKDAVRKDVTFVTAKYNRAALLNYYRLFSKAKPLWDQVLVISQSADAYDGLAISQQGLGDESAAEGSLRKASSNGADSGRFSKLFLEAARAEQSPKGASKCADIVGRLDNSSLMGFEKQSVEHLKEVCKR